jgi:hypothetical protein
MKLVKHAKIKKITVLLVEVIELEVIALVHQVNFYIIKIETYHWSLYYCD